MLQSSTPSCNLPINCQYMNSSSQPLLISSLFSVPCGSHSRPISSVVKLCNFESCEIPSILTCVSCVQALHLPSCQSCPRRRSLYYQPLEDQTLSQSRHQRAAFMISSCLIETFILPVHSSKTTHHNNLLLFQ